MASKFTHRSFEKELLDLPDIEIKLVHKNLRELDLLNRLSGGHALTLKGLKTLLVDRNRHYRIIDLGCGSGDALKYLAIWARRNGFKVELVGVDFNPIMIDYLKHHCKDYPEIKGEVADVVDFTEKLDNVDIVISTLFMHHLNDDQLVQVFGNISRKAIIGFVINDLRRRKIAYYGSILLTYLLNGTSLSKNDGPLSVLKAFKRNELVHLFQKTGLQHYTIQKKGLFRFLITFKKHEKPAQ